MVKFKFIILFKAKIIAAAFDEPPPNPELIGIFLCIFTLKKIINA